MSLPRVLLDPYFRPLDALFPPEELARLRSFAHVTWARDGRTRERSGCREPTEPGPDDHHAGRRRRRHGHRRRFA